MTVPRVCFAFEIHQPFRLNEAIRYSNPGKVSSFESWLFSPSNRDYCTRIAAQCYIPATELLLESLDRDFRCALSFSGTVIEQIERWSPDALDLFSQAAAHRNTEVLGQTYYHSLAGLFENHEEFAAEIRHHRQLMEDLFCETPSVFENTELILDERIARTAADLGFDAVYTEGADRVLGGRSPNCVYATAGIPTLLRHGRLSDDIAFRFSDRTWEEWPLTAATYARWLAATPGDCTHVFLDYESFGEHHWSETGILDFFEVLPAACEEQGVECALPAEIARLDPVGELSIEYPLSWADREKDVSAWLGNRMQKSAFCAMQDIVALRPEDPLYRYLLTSDHFYYFSTKNGSCGYVHEYFNPQDTAEDAFSLYMHAVAAYFRQFTALRKSRTAARALRIVPPEEAFHFRDDGGQYVTSAHSLAEFADALAWVPAGTLRHHGERGDFSRWVADVLGEPGLAETIEDSTDRGALCGAVNARRDALWKRLK
ncbi:MAG: alpha-amylase [Methanomicrobiaceae archaeon]|nr:alpha-amylase [Methanomicrobiaceae archaeon]